jgi:hypothetical protein
MEQEDDLFHFRSDKGLSRYAMMIVFLISSSENDPSDTRFAGMPKSLARVGARAFPNRLNIIQRLDGKSYLI